MIWSKLPPDVQGLLGWFLASLLGGMAAVLVGEPLLAVFFCVAGGYASAQYDDGLKR